MLAAGIDVGARFTKVVIVNSKEIIGYGKVLTGFDLAKSIDDAFNYALDNAKIKFDDIESIVGTGMGKEACLSSPYNARRVYSEIVTTARGAKQIFPDARTVIDIGAEDCRVSRCDDEGKVLDFATNDKCAAGTGTFLEVLARVLEVKIEDLGSLALKSSKSIPINAQCTVFAESEVISLIHHFKVEKEDIARSIYEALASRIGGIVRRVGINKDVILVGGPSSDHGLVQYLSDNLGVELLIPEKPEYISAYGAALMAMG
jgi:benzoyl-CoA reductase subunit D